MATMQLGSSLTTNLHTRTFFSLEESVWQKFDTNLCPNAEYLQKRLIQLKTNYWNLDEARQQAEILKKTIEEYIATK